MGYLPAMFHSDKTNPGNGRLIFTTHDTSLLDQDLVRRYQGWFVEKISRGFSHRVVETVIRRAPGVIFACLFMPALEQEIKMLRFVIQVTDTRVLHRLMQKTLKEQNYGTY